MYHVEGTRHWNEQYEHGLRVAYDIHEKEDYTKYNGSIEMHLAWSIAQKFGFSREEFLRRFPVYVSAMLEHLDEWSQKGPVFQSIPEAVALVDKLSTQKKFILGLLTGNARRIADWKLAHTGLLNYFSFGLYGEEADDRIALAKLVFEKAKRELRQVFVSKDIVVIGDTIHDIRCGKAIGAVTIAVTTGMHGDPAALEKEKPDLLVDSLADPRVEGVLLRE